MSGGGIPAHRPKPFSSTVSKNMSRMPRRDTRPELAARREMHSRGMRFRVSAALPGRPDIVLTRAKIAIFIDGCFWHACPEHGNIPKNNSLWWSEKLARNQRRDGEKDAALIAMGWSPLHFWEHEPVADVVDLIEAAWREATRRRP